jgi:hypothetical protein
VGCGKVMEILTAQIVRTLKKSLPVKIAPGKKIPTGKNLPAPGKNRPIKNPPGKKSTQENISPWEKSPRTILFLQ